jgi:hypothetical protein
LNLTPERDLEEWPELAQAGRALPLRNFVEIFLARHAEDPVDTLILQSLIAVQIVATGFSGLRFLRQSQHHISEDFIDVCKSPPG